MRHWKRWLMIAGVFMAAIIVLSWLNTPSIEVIHAKRGPAVQAVYATGTVEATIMLPIATRLSARLAELNADEGDEVQEGQLIARLEDTESQRLLDQLRAQSTYAKQEFERAKLLVKTRSSSRRDFDLAKSNLDAARAAVAKAEAETSYLHLHAPACGRIIRRDGEIGQLITANEPVFWLATHAPLRITAEVDEEDIALVKPNMKVLIRADAFDGRIFHGTVHSITPKGDPISRSYRVRIRLSGMTPLRIGMTAETNIIIRESKNALLLPATTVMQDYVWVVNEEDEMIKTPVRTGANTAEYSEVLEGIDEKTRVVHKPDDTLANGQRFTPETVTW